MPVKCALNFVQGCNAKLSITFAEPGFNHEGSLASKARRSLEPFKAAEMDIGLFQPYEPIRAPRFMGVAAPGKMPDLAAQAFVQFNQEPAIVIAFHRSPMKVLHFL